MPYYTKDTLRASWALREHAFTPGTVRGRWLHCTKDTLRASWVQGEIPTASAIHSERWSSAPMIHFVHLERKGPTPHSGAEAAV